MPNLKIFVEHAIWTANERALTGAIEQIRDLLCSEFAATPERCHIMLVPAFGLADQAGVYVDMNFRPSPARIPERVMAVCGRIESVLRVASSAAVRMRATAQGTVYAIA